MSNKDYSHIKQGMYVLISELGDKKDEVVEAFSKAKGVGYVYVDFFKDELYLGFSHSYINTYAGVENFGENAKQVSVDFILNGPKKELPTTFEEFVQDCVDTGKGFKVKVNPETSSLVQETVFKCGGKWCGESTCIKELQAEYLFFYGGTAELTKTEGDSDYFEKHRLPEITVDTVTTLTYNVVEKEEDNKEENLEKKLEELEAKFNDVCNELRELKDKSNNND